MTETHLHTPSAPRSTVERISLTVLPPAVHRFLFSQSEEFQVAHLVFRALFGAVSGTVLFLGVSHSLPLTFDLQLAAGGFFVGPLSNIQRNVETAALSLSCNLDLQVHHGRLLWRDAVRPVLLIAQEVTDDGAQLQSEALSVSRTFQNIRDEVVLQYGYDRFKPEHAAAAGSSTQEQFTSKTMMQCDSVVDEGVQRCADWFSLRWAECMEAIPVPVINHILCVSMKFHFLCDVMRVMTPWCREQIPVEGNFGQLFDQINGSVDLLSREFSAELVLQERGQRSVLGGAVLDWEFTRAIRGSFRKLTAAVKQLLDVLQLLLSFTFVTIFTQAFAYLRRYRRDVRFDNVYITTYFRQIDARRRRAGKISLLPLRQAEKKCLIEPWSLKVCPEELRQVVGPTRGGRHQVDISVGGASMMARLLRKTVSAFNSSSSLNIQTDNQEQQRDGESERDTASIGHTDRKRHSTEAAIQNLTKDDAVQTRRLPGHLRTHLYLCLNHSSVVPSDFLCLQVYTNRLRRVIAAFYHPKREKQRVLFLYNLQLQRRTSSSDRKRIISRGRRSRTVSVCD
ncbi:E3 ubiquitin-protein ligase DCST1 [Chaetodon trifascialis]|uniref:E3 ubiquitin-protein ligase DCST1 n=1 Tax=Chaetodon trifascialis TaxID=109706 RepID=UPI003994C932